MLLARDSGGEEDRVNDHLGGFEYQSGGRAVEVDQDKVLPQVMLLARDSEGEEDRVDDHLGGGEYHSGGRAGEVDQDKVLSQVMLLARDSGGDKDRPAIFIAQVQEYLPLGTAAPHSPLLTRLFTTW